MPSYNFSFWNLENLFDIEHSPRRNDKIRRALGSSIVGWSQDKLDQKITQLSTIIKKLDDDKGPDILGICEVENKHVLDLLVQQLSSLHRNYKIAHHDMSDRRGIDVAFIYDDDLFEFEMLFDHVVVRRTATRDLLQVNFLSRHSGERIVLIANHWPSRSGGQYESEGYRHIAGETLSYFHSRIREEHGENTPVIAMGDFNDEPHNTSLSRHALSLRSQTRVKYGQIPYFYNMMWNLMDDNVGTFYFNNLPNMLDQFLVNENVIKSNSQFKVNTDSVMVHAFEEMTHTGRYPAPLAYGGMGKPVNPDGFSDHFPISLTVSEN